jgi:hypothetical protein
MTITINDTRNTKQVLNRFQLTEGSLYLNQFGRYVIFTDNSCLVDLKTGELIDSSEYDADAEFTPISARLEVYA